MDELADQVQDASRRILDVIARDRRFAHTSHLRVQLEHRPLVDVHLRGPEVADVFSITKTVLALGLGAMSVGGLLPDLDSMISNALPELSDSPSRTQTWRQLLSMTRGAETDGDWDIDAITARPGGQVAQVAAAPVLEPAGRTFRYDNGAAHLLSAAASRLLGEPISVFVERELFAPLGIQGASWIADPDGIPYGYAHLRLSADHLARLGQLVLDHGRVGSDVLVDQAFLKQMITAHTAGGPPEGLGYGFLTWIGDGYLLAGGWAGQHLIMVPKTNAVVVVSGDPQFEFGPPPSDQLPPDWRPAVILVRRHLLPLLR